MILARTKEKGSVKPGIQKQEEPEEEEPIQEKPDIQRQSVDEEEESVQAEPAI